MDLFHDLRQERFLQPRFPVLEVLLLVLEEPQMLESFHLILDVLRAHHRVQQQVAVHVHQFHPSFCPSWQRWTPALPAGGSCHRSVRPAIRESY